MTETRTDTNGREVAVNSGWPVTDDDKTSGDVTDHLERFGEAVRLAQLPTGSIEERDPGVVPACAFCNAEYQRAERVMGDPDGPLHGANLADYALVGEDSGDVKGYSCHACIQ